MSSVKHKDNVEKLGAEYLLADWACLLGELSPQGAPSVRCPHVALRPEGAKHLWRKIPPRELSIGLEADGRFGRVTGRAVAS